MKTILYGEEGRKELATGIDALADAVKSTLGPKGKNVVISRPFGPPIVTKDGVTVAKEVELESPGQQLGVELVRQAASKTNDDVGDGTTTATVLCQEMIHLGFDGLKNAKFPLDVHAVRAGMNVALKDISEKLEEGAEAIAGNKDRVKQVAVISANNNEEMGTLVADMVTKAGPNGVISVLESQSVETETEHVEGMQFEKGYVSPYMVTDGENMEAALTDALILITDTTISSVQELVPLLEKIAASQVKELVIIAEDLTGEALSTLVMNKLRGNFTCLAVKAPGFGDNKKETLEDIAILTGGKVVTVEAGLSLATADLDVLGRAKTVKATKDKTTIVGGKGDKKAIATRVKQIQGELEKSDSNFDKEKLKERLGKLDGGVSVIKVGAATESEMKEKKYLVEDAVSATQAALESGIVSGGGAALLKAAEYKEGESTMNSSAFGESIVRKACAAPMTQIMVNAGANVGELWDSLSTHEGYDAKGEVMLKDMKKSGIVDPLSVVQNALKNAVSVASVILTTDCVMVNIPEEPKMPQGM